VAAQALLSSAQSPECAQGSQFGAVSTPQTPSEQVAVVQALLSSAQSPGWAQGSQFGGGVEAADARRTGGGGAGVVVVGAVAGLRAGPAVRAGRVADAVDRRCAGRCRRRSRRLAAAVGGVEPQTPRSQVAVVHVVVGAAGCAQARSSGGVEAADAVGAGGGGAGVVVVGAVAGLAQACSRGGVEAADAVGAGGGGAGGVVVGAVAGLGAGSQFGAVSAADAVRAGRGRAGVVSSLQSAGVSQDSHPGRRQPPAPLQTSVCRGPSHAEGAALVDLAVAVVVHLPSQSSTPLPFLTSSALALFSMAFTRRPWRCS
jgi:hypothetical protein